MIAMDGKKILENLKRLLGTLIVMEETNEIAQEDRVANIMRI